MERAALTSPTSSTYLTKNQQHGVMMAVKSVDEIKNLMGRINLIQGRPTFTMIRHLEKQLIAGVKRIQYRA